MISKHEQKLIRTAEKLIKSTERVATLSSTKPRSSSNGGGSIMLQRAKEAHEGAAKAWTDLVNERLADVQGEAPRQPGRPGRKPKQAVAETVVKPRGRNGRRETNAVVAA